MKERPILFSGPMVRALLSGQKTQTRRVVKAGILLDHLKSGWKPEDIANGVASMCPYGQIGDRLWVRETWGINDWTYGGTKPIPKTRPADLPAGALTYQATEDDAEILNEMPFRPSIHMPRWASRLTLQITDIRVERLQDISEADALAEGVQPRKGSPGPNFYTVDTGFFSANAPTASEVYRMLWELINGDDSWSANPWVWAITFEVVK